jgi:hypothetical protein
MANVFPEGFDQTYFSAAPWRDRLARWCLENTSRFAASNVESMSRILDDNRTSVRVVINIRADALLSFLSEGRYRNIYEMPMVGGKGPDRNRLDADQKVGTGPGHYFAAAAMGGVGIRYYGEYCLVLNSGVASARTQVFDRDSYDVLFSPLANLSQAEVDCLKGTWQADIGAMIMLRVLPEVTQQRQIVTSGTVIELALKDQEFIEVHLDQVVTPQHIDQVVESPDTVATEARILERRRSGRPLREHEHEWVRRRGEVLERLDQLGIRHRVVTQTGRGYQWR